MSNQTGRKKKWKKGRKKKELSKWASNFHLIAVNIKLVGNLGCCVASIEVRL